MKDSMSISKAYEILSLLHPVIACLYKNTDRRVLGIEFEITSGHISCMPRLVLSRSLGDLDISDILHQCISLNVDSDILQLFTSLRLSDKNNISQRISFREWPSVRNQGVRQTQRRRERKASLKIGDRIGISLDHLGSLGNIVLDKNDPNKPYILSCWHVLANEGSRVGNRIIHPRLGYIADLASNEKPKDTGVDAAIAKINNEYKDKLPEENYLCGVEMINSRHFKTQVLMQGGTSGLSVGEITALSAYAFDYSQDEEPFCLNGFKIEPRRTLKEISKPGDSGSIWFVEEERRSPQNDNHCGDLYAEDSRKLSPSTHDEQNNYGRVGIGIHVNGGKYFLIDKEKEDDERTKSKRNRNRTASKGNPFAFACLLDAVYDKLPIFKPHCHDHDSKISKGEHIGGEPAPIDIENHQKVSELLKSFEDKKRESLTIHKAQAKKEGLFSVNQGGSRSESNKVCVKISDDCPKCGQPIILKGRVKWDEPNTCGDEKDKNGCAYLCS